VWQRLRCTGALLAEGNSKSAWKYIREVTFTTPKGDKTTLSLPLLNEAFARTVQAKGTESVVSGQGCDQENGLQLQPVEEDEVFRLLNATKSSTAMGCDELPGFLIKMLASAITKNIALIFNRSISDATVPTTWKQANVVAIWKQKGNKSDPGNYRPVSVLPILGRTLEKAIANQLNAYCEDREVIPPQQFGFRKNSSCESALIRATDDWMGAIDEGKYVGALLVDLSKAFDTVPHQQLLNNLREIGCSTSTLQWFHSYLTGRLQRVIQKPEVTSWMPVTRGVPQGSCLSPSLFNIYVRRLPEITSSDSVQFADDVTLAEKDNDLEVITEKLTVSFNEVKAFCEERELTINPAKTQFIVFKAPGKRIPDEFSITLDNTEIKPESTVKLLGCTLDKHLTFKDHIEATSQKCHGLLGALSRASPFLPSELLMMAFTALIRSHLEYASAIFAAAAPTHLKKLDLIQRMAARIVCHAPRWAHSAPLIQRLELEDLSDRRSKHVGKIVEQIVKGACQPSLRDMFSLEPGGEVGSGATARIGVGRRRFSFHAVQTVNDVHRNIVVK
jgi:hypothetical protein